MLPTFVTICAGSYGVGINVYSTKAWRLAVVSNCEMTTRLPQFLGVLVGLSPCIARRAVNYTQCAVCPADCNINSALLLRRIRLISCAQQQSDPSKMTSERFISRALLVYTWKIPDRR